MSSEAPQERGSRKMIEERFGVKAFIGENELTELLKIVEQEGIELGNILVRGQPAPDWMSGTFKVQLERAADPVLSLIKLRYRCDVFPYGIPVINGVLVNFETAGQPGR